MPNTVGDLVYPKKPPRYWVAAKRRLGMNDAALGRIWYQNYKDEKRIAAWLAASDEEWREHGLRRPNADI
ncbi:MAG TPA: hypothetical protein VIV09_14605 [Pseudolabrys sp.]